MKTFKRLFAFTAIAAMAAALSACGDRVEIPPAHVGKIVTKDGYAEGVRGTSKFRLDWCWAYCDRLVILDIGDRAAAERGIEIFMPKDKLMVVVDVQTTLQINPQRAEELFTLLPPVEDKNNSSTMRIAWDTIYRTYAQQIVLTETREYLSQFSINELTSSMEMVNNELRTLLQDKITSRTPFDVRYVGITKVKYPDIITESQKKAAERREEIHQEEAQLAKAMVILERELEEARLRRQIEKEKADTEALAQVVLRDVVDDRVLELRRLENQRLWIETWDGKLPSTMAGADGMLLMKDLK